MRRTIPEGFGPRTQPGMAVALAMSALEKTRQSSGLRGWSRLAGMSWTTILLMLLAGLAGAGVAALLYLPTRRSIRELRETAEAFSRGDWRERADVAPSASEEVRRLGELVNDTAEQTLRQLKDLSRQKGDLEALVDSLPDPLVLADTRRKIIRINRPAAELLGVSRERALGESLEAAVTDPAVLSIFDEAARIEAG